MSRFEVRDKDHGHMGLNDTANWETPAQAAELEKK